MNKSTVNFCPVPKEQQPIYEYQQLKETWLFDWGTLTVGKYSRKIAWVGFWSAILAIPLAMSVFVPRHDWLHCVLSSLIGICILAGIFLSRIYLGWQYVRDRLKSDRIFYEESGWYDGQTWIKPTTMLNRDRLIASYEIDPILSRFHKTYGLFAGIIALNSLIWLIFS
ncbi:MAG: CGLD27 family protein [Pleurocapsa sp. MO_226.B13]|nr:CGLD27 family protein [Pleurocapsa sp. MO_226.B13]